MVSMIIKVLVIIIVWKPPFTCSLEVHFFLQKYLNSVDGDVIILYSIWVMFENSWHDFLSQVYFDL